MQFCVFFAVITSLLALDVVGAEEVASSAPKLCAIVLSQALIVAVAWAITCQARVDAGRWTLRRQEAAARLERRCQLHLALWFGMSVCTLTCFGWARMVAHAGVTGALPFSELILLMPIISPLILSWAVFHDAECALNPAAESHSRWRFVVHQMRSFLLLPLVPIISVLVWGNLLESCFPGIAESPWAAPLLAVPMIVLLVLSPILFCLLWPTERLPRNELRRRLELLAARHQFALTDMFVWKTDHRMLNAAITGLVPRLRFVLLTDRLVDELDTDAVESIFLHEMAHAKQSHGLRLAAVLCGSTLPICLYALAGATGAPALDYFALSAHSGLVLVIGLLFTSWHARLLELQADIWAAKRATSVERYTAAIAKLAAGAYDRTTWTHPSVRKRGSLLAQGRDGEVWLTQRLGMAWALFLLWTGVSSLVAVLLAYF